MSGALDPGVGIGNRKPEMERYAAISVARSGPLEGIFQSTRRTDRNTHATEVCLSTKALFRTHSYLGWTYNPVRRCSQRTFLSSWQQALSRLAAQGQTRGLTTLFQERSQRCSNVYCIK